jgi:undecaprenyl-diphosphatase
MNYIQTIIISIIEGVTEFLPISSTGHMILASHLLKIPESNFLKSFEIIIQLGAILAVVVLYSKRFITDKQSWVKITAAFIPAAGIGFFLYKIIKTYLLSNPYITVLTLGIGGIILILIEKFLKPKSKTISDLTIKQSFLIGIFQTISMVPGVSRSASTIIGSMIVGLSRKEAVEFSFLLAIPTMVAATGLDIYKTSLHFTAQEIQMLSMGFIIAFITAIVAIRSFISFVERHNFIGFGIYRIILALSYWFLILRI